MNPLQYNTTAFPSRTFLPFSSGDDTSILAPPESVQVTKHALLDRCNYLSQDPYFSDYEARPLTFTTLTNARLVHGTLVVTEQNTCLRETAYQATLRTNHLQHPLREFPEGIEAPKHYLVPSKTIKEPCFLFNTLRANYGHWHTQALVNCAYLQPVAAALNVDIGTLRLINNCGFDYSQAYREQSIGLFGLDRAVFVTPPDNQSEGCIEFETLIVPSTLSVPPGITYHPFIGQYLRSRMLARSGSVHNSASQKLFVSRRDVQGRRGLSNEAALANRLKDYGFKTVTCSDLNYMQQLDLFSTATHVVSTHAGALTNLLASPPRTKVLEIFHSQQLNPWYRNLCDSVGHDYQAYVTALDDSSQLTEAEVWLRTYNVDLDIIAQLVSEM
jgi:hypothetical protein